MYVGTGKAGTTWLHKVLSAHPDVYVASAKETNYFDLNYERGEGWYLNHFSGAADYKSVGEIAHRYIRDGRIAHKIRRDLGLVKILVGLREPVSYFLSDYQFTKRSGLFSGSVEDYAERGFDWDALSYRKMISPYVAEFGVHNVLLNDFSLLERDPQFYLDRICIFLEVTPFELSADLSGAVNIAKTARSHLITKPVTLTSKWLKRRGQQRLVHIAKSNAAVQRILYKSVKERPIVPPYLQKRLRSEVIDDLRWLEDNFHLDLSASWAFPPQE